MEVQQLHTERSAAGCADKETKRIMSRARRKRAQVRALLEEMYVWQDIGLEGTQCPPRLTDDEVKSLYMPGHRPPWATEATTAAAVRRHQGRLYYTAAADLVVHFTNSTV